VTRAVVIPRPLSWISASPLACQFGFALVGDIVRRILRRRARAWDCDRTAQGRSIPTACSAAMIVIGGWLAMIEEWMMTMTRTGVDRASGDHVNACAAFTIPPHCGEGAGRKAVRVGGTPCTENALRAAP